MIQLEIPLPRRTALGRTDFFVSESNAAALAWIDRSAAWPQGTLLLLGPPQSGKTHLVHLWRERTGAEIIAGGGLSGAVLRRLLEGAPRPLAVDDAESAPQEALLHLCNAWAADRAGLLLTARRPPGFWPLTLPDLRSRLLAALAARIGEPDDALLAALLVKHFADRQLRPAPGVLSYALPRMERSFAGAAALAARLDAAALSEGRPISIPLVRRVLAQGRDHSSDLGVT